MALASSFECSVCMERFDWNTARKPMSLVCGHTFCLGCINQFQSKTCPDCRTAFIAPAPNFSIWNIISALAPSAAEPQFKKAVEEQIEAINNQVVSKQLEVTKCEAEVQSAQKQVLSAQSKLLAANEEMRQLHSALLPLKVSLGFTGLNRNGGLTGKDGGGGGSKISNAPLLVVLAASTNLGEILNDMNMKAVPAIYDFQGKNMVYADRGVPTIYIKGVTWRNGTITLQSGQSLVVACQGVVMESVSIKAGVNGLRVQDGGSICMTGCEISDADVALFLDGNSAVVASNLKISCCVSKGAQLNSSSSLRLTGLKMVNSRAWTQEGFVLAGSASAEFTDCFISDITSDAFCMDSTSSMVGTNVTISKVKQNVLKLKGKAKATLTTCKLIEAGILVTASGEACVVLTRCAFDAEIKKSEAATVTINRS